MAKNMEIDFENSCSMVPHKPSASKTIDDLKANFEDFEWYPTTDEIITAMAQALQGRFNDRDSNRKILDIGAGDGRVLAGLEKKMKPSNWSENGYKHDYLTKYAIEMSQVLINQMPANIFIIGTDFKLQTLIDKQMDVIFCNPPYSEYVDWTIKIITEAYSKRIFLVIPKRWKENKQISEAIEKTKFKTKIIGSFDFKTADRKARAEVDLIEFWKSSNSYYGGSPEDPFERWFGENFKINTAVTEPDNIDDASSKLKNELVTGANLIERMETMYQNDLNNLLQAYKALENLTPRLLKELDVTISNAAAALKLKITGLKKTYWSELFDRLNKLTDKLCNSSRKKMLETLTANTSIDFTADNVYAVVIWAIKNANTYFDQQLLELFESMTYKDYIIAYKSNQRIINSDWRYNLGHNMKEKDPWYTYALDYRIIWYCGSCFGGYWRDGMRECGISNNAWQQINDFCVVARNLGFDVINSPDDFKWSPGKKNVFMMKYKDKTVQFAEIKAYMNGNVHTKFNKDFMARFNIEAGRLRGWLHSPGDAVDELGSTPEQAAECFGSNLSIGSGRDSVLMLTM